MRTEGTKGALVMLRRVADFLLDCVGYRPEARLFEEQAARQRLWRACLDAKEIASLVLSLRGVRLLCGTDRTVPEAFEALAQVIGVFRAGVEAPAHQERPDVERGDG